MDKLPHLSNLLFFIAHSNPTTPLDHDNGFEGCIIGQYAKHLGLAVAGQSAIDSFTVRTNLWYDLSSEAGLCDSDSAKTFVFYLGNSGLDYSGSWATIGDMQRALAANWPDLQAPTVTKANLKEALAIRFPGVWTKPGEDFSQEFKGSLWTGEDSWIQINCAGDMIKVPAFDYHDEFGLYPYGVLETLAKWLESHGFYAEAYDGGTFFIWER